MQSYPWKVAPTEGKNRVVPSWCTFSLAPTITSNVGTITPMMTWLDVRPTMNPTTPTRKSHPNSTHNVAAGPSPANAYGKGHEEHLARRHGGFVRRVDAVPDCIAVTGTARRAPRSTNGRYGSVRGSFVPSVPWANQEYIAIFPRHEHQLDPVPSCEGGLRGSHTPGPALQQGGGRWPVDVVLVDARIMHRKLPVAPV